MKTVHVVLAACAALVACSQEPAKEATATAAPAVTREMLGGRDIGLTALSLSRGPETEAFGIAQRNYVVSLTVGNATDAPMTDPWLTCLVGDAKNPALVTLQLKGVVPAKGTAAFPDTRLGWMDDGDGDARCAIGIEEPARSTGPNRAPEGATLATKPAT